MWSTDIQMQSQRRPRTPKDQLQQWLPNGVADSAGDESAAATTLTIELSQLATDASWARPSPISSLVSQSDTCSRLLLGANMPGEGGLCPSLDSGAVSVINCIPDDAETI